MFSRGQWISRGLVPEPHFRVLRPEQCLFCRCFGFQGPHTPVRWRSALECLGWWKFWLMESLEVDIFMEHWYMTGERMILEPEKMLNTTGRNHPTEIRKSKRLTPWLPYRGERDLAWIKKEETFNFCSQPFAIESSTLQWVLLKLPGLRVIITVCVRNPYEPYSDVGSVKDRRSNAPKNVGRLMRILWGWISTKSFATCDDAISKFA